ncbi:amidohydrolase family protein [Alloacidobacterium dinghuense]|uniref:Amidohydrolase family protein n=1 Tax=Alloacidobacterium dinghuense TaxID=2763107 RepID=A0A7G8BQ74_9BACT|nr:amidohydrolase family protein [Alloacidobacterium dinghuense]QNI34694.1 amidohydrolase family protein [Alloacidobacterium dinghuense]
MPTSRVSAQQLPEAVPATPAEYQQTYDRLLKAIEAIPIFDNHGHPGFADDSNVDAMVSPPDASAAFRLRAENPELIAASKALFGYPFDDNSPEHLQWLAKKKAQLKQEEKGYQYFDTLLDELNIEQAVANRVELGTYLSPKRFLWVFFVDSLLFPFNNHALIARNGDLAVFIPLQEKKLKNELSQEKLQQPPATLDDYLRFATRLLEDNKQHCGVGIKFEIAYFRPLHFDDPPKQTAETTYAKYRNGGTPSEAEYKDFQDYLFRYLISEAGRLHLPVQIHSAVGIGDYYSVSNGTALQLENVLRDPRYSSTTFVLLHGGYPFQEQAIWLTTRKNVYLDSSLMGLYLYPADLKNVLRHWLLLFPDKVVFGSDAFPFSEAVGAEESYWIAVRSARVALAAALTEMLLNHEVTNDQALAFAHGYLHDNAARLYAK